MRLAIFGIILALFVTTHASFARSATENELAAFRDAAMYCFYQYPDNNKKADHCFLKEKLAIYAANNITIDKENEIYCEKYAKIELNKYITVLVASLYFKCVVYFSRHF